MESFKIDVNDILRFTGIGIFIIFIVGYENAPLLDELKELGGVSIIALAFIGGNIFYYVYRTLIYTPLIIKLKDILFRDQKYYTRTYFKNELGCTSTKEANMFFYYLRGKVTMKAMTKEASSIHLMYMTSIIFIFYSGYKLVNQQFSFIILLIISLVVGLAAFLSDRGVEKFDYHQVRGIDNDELKQHWEDFRSHLM